MDEACGVFGCVPAEGTSTEGFDVATCLYNGLINLQHRGQESAGIVASVGEQQYMLHDRGKGLISTVFSAESLKKLHGCAKNRILFDMPLSGAKLGIAHTRYSTMGVKDGVNCIQPYIVHTVHGLIALAHNGEIVNSSSIRRKMLRTIGLSTDTDSEVLAQLLATADPARRLSSPQVTGRSRDPMPGPDWPAAIRQLMNTVQLAYSVLLLTQDKVYAFRDPFGNRPLSIGFIPNPGANGVSLNGCAGSEVNVKAWVAASETCAFHNVQATLLRDVEPGEVVEISPTGVVSLGIHSSTPKTSSFCIFEYVYFARPDSVFEQRFRGGILFKGQQVYQARYECGRELGLEAPPPDLSDCIVSTVPDSATPAALGYANSTKLPYTEVLHKSRYEGRTFIQPSDAARREGVARKFAPLQANYAQKRVVIIDDSIVRGNTMKPIVELLRRTGAREVHIRIASPPLRHPCYMGINIPTREELIANRMDFPADLGPGENLTQFAAALKADSVVYLSLPGLRRAVTTNLEGVDDAKGGYCAACLDGHYPVEPEGDTAW